MFGSHVLHGRNKNKKFITLSTERKVCTKGMEDRQPVVKI